MFEVPIQSLNGTHLRTDPFKSPCIPDFTMVPGVQVGAAGAFKKSQHLKCMALNLEQSQLRPPRSCPTNFSFCLYPLLSAAERLRNGVMRLLSLPFLQPLYLSHRLTFTHTHMSHDGMMRLMFCRRTLGWNTTGVLCSGSTYRTYMWVLFPLFLWFQSTISICCIISLRTTLWNNCAAGPLCSFSPNRSVRSEFCRVCPHSRDRP